jgi:hypothetical protein
MEAPAPQAVAVEKVAEMEVIEGDAAGAYAPPGLAQPIERLIIRTGNISLVVEDTRATKATIEQMVSRLAAEGAYIVSSEEYGGDDEKSQPRISMSIRVPSGQFDPVMDRLAELAVQVTNRSESASDITEEYVDLDSRVESLEAARDRLLEIMEDARTTKDLLEAEQQLTYRESEIESLKGRMQYLEQSARLSNIWIDIQPYILSQPVSDKWRPAETLRRAVKALANGLRDFADFAIFLGVAVLPWLLAVALVVYVVYRLVRRRARKRARDSGSADAPSSPE